MKLRVRVLIFLFVVFMLVVSFKILEPELQQKLSGTKSDDISQRISIDNIISTLIENYKVDLKSSLNESPWKLAAKWVGWRNIHPKSTPGLGTVLHELSTREILSADVGYKGTQLKLSLILKGGQVAAFKPRWYSRDDIMTGKPYSGADRHNAEIAAFHLGRLLDLRRTPLAVGRFINLRTEVIPVATPDLLATFFTRENDTCFYGKCYYCKGEKDGVCGHGEIMEGTMVLWLPPPWKLQLAKHPWSRTYREGKLAKWETDPDYCSKVQMVPMFRTGPRLLDLIDTALFDYLIGNADRHHFEYFKGDNASMVLILDNAKSFGNPYTDERTILAPLYQCCQFRLSTWKRLLTLQDGILSAVMKAVLLQDPLSPILTDAHLVAMDRRLKTILIEMEKCVARNGVNVIVMDESYI